MEKGFSIKAGISNGELMKELKYLNRKYGLAGKELAAIGRVEHIQNLMDMLRALGLHLSAIVDNDTKKEGLAVNGIMVYKPEKYLQPRKENVFILIYSPKYWQDISEQFRNLGYVEKKQFVVLNKPSARLALSMVRKGDRIYRGICREYGSDVQALVVRGPVGDFYLLALFLEAYLKKEKITNYVLAGDSKGFTKIADLFQIGNDRIVFLEEKETDCLIQAYIFGGFKQYHLHLLTIWQKLSFNPCLVKYRDGFTFMDTIRTFTYGLPADTQPSRPLFDALDKGLAELCAEMGMERGKTVVLSPYAYSLQSLPMHFWQQLADRLAERGYTVCVNVDVKKEKCELQNVIPVGFTFRQSAAVLAYAGYLIGIRSGFMDITSNAACKKIVLYPQYIKEAVANQWHRTDLEFCGLVNMGLCDDAVELEYPLMDRHGEMYMRNGHYDENMEREMIDLILSKL